MTDLVKDLFTEASNTNLEAHTADIGSGTWAQHVILANTMYIPAGTNNVFGTLTTTAAYTYSQTITGDFTLEATVRFASSANRVGIITHARNNEVTFYQFYFNGTNSRWELSKHVNNTPTVLATDTTASMAVNTDHKISLEFVGNVITARVTTGTTTVTLTPVTETTLLTAGYVGVRSSQDTSSLAALRAFDSAGAAVAPVLSSGSASSTGASTGTASVTTDKASGTLYYLVNTSATATGTAIKAGLTQTVTASGVKTVSLTGLSASTTYYVHFLHSDSAGDSNIIDTASFTTSAGAVPPVLSSGSASSTGTTTGTASVTTDKSSGTLYYLVNTASTATVSAVKAGLTQAVSSSGVKTVSLTGLTASTTYYVHFVHSDSAGDSNVINTASFTTSASSDTTPPVLSGSVTALTINTTSVTISWTAGTDNIGITSYEYALNSGSWVSFGNTNTTQTITGLTASTNYNVSIRAKDAAGNASSIITSTTFTTLAVSGTAPQISTQPSNQTVTAGQTATFSVVVSNPSGCTYQAEKKQPDGSWRAITGATSSTYTTPVTS